MLHPSPPQAPAEHPFADLNLSSQKYLCTKQVLTNILGLNQLTAAYHCSRLHASFSCDHHYSYPQPLYGLSDHHFGCLWSSLFIALHKLCTLQLAVHLLAAWASLLYAHLCCMPTPSSQFKFQWMCKAFITQNVTKWLQSTLQFCRLWDEVTAISNVSRRVFASRSQWKLLARASMSTHEYRESFALSCWAKGKWCPSNREACCSVLLAQNGSPEPLTSLAWKPHSSSTLSLFHLQQTITGTWWSCQPPTYQPWWKTWSFLTLYLGGFCCCWRLNNYKVNIRDIHYLFANVAQRLLLYLPLASARQA